MATMEPILCTQLGRVPYADARQLQKRLEAARHAGAIPDALLLLEHPPVYTKGRRSTADELPMGEEWYRMQGIEVLETDRGGRVTYHGPGQLVAYPIVSLRPYGDDVHLYVRNLERVMIDSLAEHGIEATVFEGLTGVWTDGVPPGLPGEVAPAPAESGTARQARKIGSIGVHVNRGITTHGLAINVNNDLQPFEWIVPCGIDHCLVTSLAREHGAEQDFEAFAAGLAGRFGLVFGREPRWVDPTELDPAAGALNDQAQLPRERAEVPVR